MGRMKSMIAGLLAVSLMAGAGAGAVAKADTYPSRPITIIVPFPAGGLTDIPVRLLARLMQDELKVSVVVENKTGGSGVIGADYVLRSNPDGYTFLANAVADTQNLYYMKIPYDAAKDFDFIAEIVDGPPLVMVVNTKVPYKTVAEVIADAKANPDKMSFGTSGYATSPFIALSEFNAVAGTKILPVPYRGTGDLTAALLSGDVQGMFYAFSSAKSMVDTGAARPVAVAGPARLPAWPNVPTMEESGFNGFSYNGFVGLVAPKKTPSEVIAKINKAVNDAIHSDLFKTRMAALGMTVPETAGNSPDKFHAFFVALTQRQSKVAQAIHAKGGSFGTVQK